jgi:ribosomal protein S6
MEQAEKRSYEIGFMARDEKGVAAVLERVKAHGGEITLEGPVEEMALAYPIKKQTQARFGFIHATMVPAEIPVLNQELERTDSVLRFLIMTPPFIKPAPRQIPEGRMRDGSASVSGASSASSAPMSSGTTRREESAPRTASAPAPLSNEALEKKIEEILKEA